MPLPHPRLLQILLLLVMLPCSSVVAQGNFRATATDLPPAFPLADTLTVGQLRDRLATAPLALPPGTIAALRTAADRDPVVRGYLELLRAEAEELLTRPILTRKMRGRRLLFVSRAALHRITLLALLHRLEADERYRDRAVAELRAVSSFTDWNPSHFLDVAEMSLAVACGLSWLHDDLTPADRNAFRTALVDLGLRPSYTGKHWWVAAGNNWNQVCHAGLIAAALAVAPDHPELATRTLNRALINIPEGLRAYGPDGVYPEGASYWTYGSGFTVVTVELLRTAFGTDFGITRSPGFLASADYVAQCEGPTGRAWNFGDASDSPVNAPLLTWFAGETGEAPPADRRLLRHPDRARGNRLLPLLLPSIARRRPAKAVPPARTWAGGGVNPCGFLRSPTDSTFYLAAKGGSGSVNHGNMDAGSFVFELDGVRWSVDVGIQPYTELELAGVRLWDARQDGERWTLLSKNNHFHSTLTANDALHQATGYAPLLYDFSTPEPHLRVDLTDVFPDGFASAERTFTRTADNALVIADALIPTKELRQLRWQLLTYADVELIPGGAILRQDGKALRIALPAGSPLAFSVTQAHPAPRRLDMQLPGLKRLDLLVPGWYLRAHPDPLEIVLRRPD